ncbi:MAG: TraB/GumN family protein [Betaproteobacteria bacterium HGW-Betaproteobacteria-1]|jgi:hypothetical protein|nr:MAG: TraB/GumN family protein [Betaproteobacteria bacterium HGW-Betaproteobacteria-1]
MRASSCAFAGLVRGLFFVLLLGFMAVAQAQDKGLLWKLEAPGGKTSYLFGTMHSDDRRVTDFPPSVMKALLDSDVFLMELQPPQDPSVYLMKEGRLDHMLTEQEFVEVIKLADFHSMHTDIATTMKPWLLAAIFDLPKPQTPYSQDAMLMSLAHGKSKTVRALESVEEHFGVLDSFSIEDQLVMLRAVLKRSPQQRERNFEELVKTYLSGDLDRIIEVNARTSGDMLPEELWARILKKLLDERNVRMAERIVLQANENSVFVAVGAAHLPGDGGLLARLRSAGYQVTPVR